jgi:hypothetical protein
MRTHSESGTRSRPNGYASRSCALVANGASASSSNEPTPKRSRSRSSWSRSSSGRGIVSSSGSKITALS